MSRLDEALRRAGRATLPVPAAGDTGVFTSAWHAAAEPSRTAAERPAIGSTPEPVSPLFDVNQPSALHGFARQWRERLAMAPDGDPALIEQFRRLAAVLFHAQTASGLRMVMVTSATPGDGKTLTAVNLAIVLSESYRRRVLLVDADLRRPSIGDIVDFHGGIGLSEALRAQSDQKLGLVKLTSLLTLLPAGQAIPDPIAGLTSPRMQRILDEAQTHFDWVILDAPPIGGMADSSLLAAMVDGVLFVVRAGQTQYPNVQKSIEALGRDRILGVVLNGVERVAASGYEKYYYSHDDARALAVRD